MDEQCFYCQDEIVISQKRYAPFLIEDDHIEHPLCPDCYHEWLQGIKG